MRLTGLEGSTESTEALIIDKAPDIDVVLSNGYAATSAGSKGALNIWRNNATDKVMCESFSYGRTTDKQSYDTITEAKAWAKVWLKKIK